MNTISYHGNNDKKTIEKSPTDEHVDGPNENDSPSDGSIDVPEPVGEPERVEHFVPKGGSELE
jgi:hypothetical protein